MRRVGQTRRRDTNERLIREALAAIGVQSFQLSIPDLGDLLCYSARDGWRVLEVKTDKGKLRPGQQRAAQTVPICLVRSVSEALALYQTRVCPGCGATEAAVHQMHCSVWMSDPSVRGRFVCRGCGGHFNSLRNDRCGVCAYWADNEGQTP